jgi:signal transduction histidine kinase/DNA-binding response OmpR family regulator
MDLGWIDGGGTAALARSIDWARTPVGAAEKWPSSLRTALSIVFGSSQPMVLWWGAERIQFYNDAYCPILGPSRHPAALGKPGWECWANSWESLASMIDAAWSGGSSEIVDELLCLERQGALEERYFDTRFTPIWVESGAVGGVLGSCTEVTMRVLAARRLEALGELAAASDAADSAPEACRRAAAALASAASDVPFALVYLVREDAGRADLGAAAGLEPGSPGAPQVIEIGDGDAAWSLAAAAEVPLDVELASLGLELDAGPWPEPVTRVRILPLRRRELEGLDGFLIAGLSPRLVLDEDYATFLRLAASHVAAAVAAARSREEQRGHREELGVLDRAKASFLHGMSHEFRTPLTLILGSVEGSGGEADLDVVRRNALRLLRMVNTMLDFAQIESGTAPVCYERVNLGTFTAEVAGQFRQLFEDAGIRLALECSPVAGEVYVDRDLFEQLLLNLISNAFKFTFEGEVRVAVEQRGDHVVVVVADTGVGIPEDEIPRLFERFHRVRGARSRSFEGTGIGLAFVAELARLHGGTVEVDSEIDSGSTFRVEIPTGRAHLPADKIGTRRRSRSPRLAAAHLGEAGQWIEHTNTGPAPRVRGASRVLVVDHNADLRRYVAEILGRAGLAVDTETDGERALAAVRERPPDLVVADVLMPRLDGIALLERLRDDPRSEKIPVILLSARAGEEARIEGLSRGATDYLVKPFSSRELVARVRTQLDLARARAMLEGERHGLQVLLDVGRLLVAELDEERLAQIVTDEATRLVGAEYGAFFATVEHGREDRYQLAALSGAPSAAFSDFPEPRATPLLGPTFRGSEVVRSGDIRRDGRFGANPPHNGLPPGHLPVVSYLAAPVVSSQGEVFGSLLLGHGEAEQFTAEDERLLCGLTSYAGIAMSNARMYQTLRQAERRKDEFLAMLGHELRNPLAPIASAAELLSTTTELGPGATGRLASTIGRQAKQMARLVDDLLDVSRIARGVIPLEMRRISLSSIVSRALEEVEHLLRQRDHALKLDIDDEVHVIGDPDRLVQVVSNLLSNAARYTKAGGRIEVEAARHDDAAVLVVADNGVGITADLLPEVFDLFTRGAPVLDPSDPGLGVGLTMVERLVELHGGEVFAASDGPDRGSRFTVRLAAAEAPARTGRGTGPAGGDGRKCRVLVVDDNVDAADMLAMLIETMGAEATVAYDGPSALELAVKLDPQLVILDIGLPGMSGIDVARRLREDPAFTDGARHLVALTGYGQPTLRAALEDAGFEEHLLKPVKPEKLRQILEQIDQSSS